MHRNFRHVILPVLLFGLAGCSASLKKRWDNFTAYYNTFYNAKVLLEKTERQMARSKLVLNTERPIRIWEAPNRAGSAELEKAITKGANVIRDHPNSKWVDDAVILMGKSYFYLTQYFSAEQKFDEAITASTDPAILKEAVFWKGRIMYEMKRYKEGSEYLQRRLGDGSLRWQTAETARIQALIASLLTEDGNFEQAQTLLVQAAPKLENALERGKAFFLLGQLSEKRRAFNVARAAYQQVNMPSLDYELRFKAKLRLAELERESGRPAVALKLFKQMANDDKNFDILGDLNYEIGRTYQRLQRFEEAVGMYRRVLAKSTQQVSGPTRAKTYYALGELARFEARDFKSAAAWFDSAAKAAPDLSKLPEGFNAAELARSFGDYSRYRKEIQRYDSLLWLGGLSQTAFDSVIEVIRKQRQAQLAAELKKKEKEANTAVVVGAPGQGQQVPQVQAGFLNHKNPALVTQGMTQFKAVWGNRPLVDNWRRMEAVRQATSSAETGKTEAASQAGKSEASLVADKIDLKEIPFTAAAKDTMRRKIGSLYYELGNLFFLGLNLPDSAEAMYKLVIRSYPYPELEAGAYYVLAELLSSGGRETAAREMATRLVVRYPGTALALRSAQRFRFADTLAVSQIDTLQQRLMAIINSLETDGPFAVDTQVKQFIAKPGVSAAQASKLLWLLARSYIEHGRNEPDFQNRATRAEQLQLKFERDMSALKTEQDSARAKLKRGNLTSSDSLAQLEIIEKQLAAPDSYDLFVFTGAAFDSARSALQTLSVKFKSEPVGQQASVLLSALRYPDPKVFPVETLDVKPFLVTEPIALLEKEKPDFLKSMKRTKQSYVFTVTVLENGKPGSISLKDSKEPAPEWMEAALGFFKEKLAYSIPMKNRLPARTTLELSFIW